MAITYDDYDFIEFKFNGKSSRDFNLYVVSSGKRYQDNLVPDFTDQTEARVGADGTNYFGSQFTKRQKPINVAFDELSEVQLRELRTWLGTKEVCPLIFSEAPYKQYYAKLQNPPQFKYLCFTNDSGERVYKGEGTINFIYYYPFAKAVHKYLNEYSAQDYPNKDQWAAASKLRNNALSSRDWTTTQITSIGQIMDNVGDLEADWKCTIQKQSLSTSSFRIVRRWYDPATSTHVTATYDNRLLKLTFPTGDIQGSLLERIAAATGGSIELNSKLQTVTYIDTNNELGNGNDKRYPCPGAITNGSFFTIPTEASIYNTESTTTDGYYFYLQAVGQQGYSVDFKWDILYY